MACGCPVLTTGQAPMTEVGGNAAYYIPRRPADDVKTWALDASKKVFSILSLSEEKKQKLKLNGLEQAAKFNAVKTLDEYEHTYQTIVKTGKDFQ